MEDILVIGGGINGAGIAADAAGRGLKVLLCEQADLASATSSASSKLIHGGLRYLPQGKIRLVHEALQEREILLAKAPHIIHPLTFILPYVEDKYPASFTRLGLFIYDHLSPRHCLAKSQRIDFSQHSAGKTLHAKFRQGFSYTDCFVDDARLVVLNALQAQQLGAQILTYTEFLQAWRYKDYWQVVLRNNLTGKQQRIEAKVLVNAAGPWVEEIIHKRLGCSTKLHSVLVKGSHIVVPKLYNENYAFTLPLQDKRVIFVIPFAQQFTLIGTTEVLYQDDPKHAIMSEAEILYLCNAVNAFFACALQPEQVVWSYAGVRPLYGNASQKLSKVSRDYHLELNTDNNQAPLLSIFGGKITTYRRLAENVLNNIRHYFPNMGPSWTAAAPLPGGDMPEDFYKQVKKEYAWLPEELVYRYVNLYGTRVEILLERCIGLADLGAPIAMNLYQREVEYLIKHEWAMTADDILWRRTKLGLFFNSFEKKLLHKIITNYLCSF